MQDRSERRQEVARGLTWLAGFAATALLVVPKGLSVFAALMFLATLLALPDALRDRRAVPRAVYALLAVAVFVIAVAAPSMWRGDARLAELDNPSRTLLLPWCAWLAWVTRMRLSGLWYGALVGLLVASAVSIAQSALGADRAGSDANPIVFANAVLALSVVAVFCRPADERGRMRLLVLAYLKRLPRLMRLPS